MEEYKSITEKKKFYGENYHQINTLFELKNFINECIEQENTRSKIYRGVSESRYKIYSSLQRAWIGKDVKSLGKYKSDKDFANHMIQYIQTNEMLNKYYSALHVVQNDWNAMCFLQHYGAPTPLIDFSYNFKVALYFCSYKLFKPESKDIDEYYSIYKIDSKKLIKMVNLLPKLKKSVKTELRNQDMEPDGNYSLLKNVTYEDVANTPNASILFDISDKEMSSIKFNNGTNINCNYYVGNLNMIAQDGALVLLNNERSALEETLQGKIEVYDIHKSLYRFIHMYLQKQGIVKTSIFPKQENIADDAYLSMIDL